MTDERKTFLDKTFKDPSGHYALFQNPNIPLVVWIICRIVSLFLDQGAIKNGLDQFGTAFLFTWAFLEITQGVNYFRRILGLVIFTAITIGFFM